MSRRAAQLTHLKSTYGITEEDYNEMLEAQEFTCAICHEHEARKRDDGSEQPLSVDHDHATGRVRGLLCHRCNTAVGLLRDDPETIARALEYLGAT